MNTVFRGADLYTVDADFTVIQSGDLYVANGKISAIGRHLNVPAGTKEVEAKGMVMTPGLIDIHTHVGIWAEVTEDVNDANEYSEPFTPLMEATDGIHLDHFSFQDAVRGGVTTVQTGAGSANPIGGIWSILKTAGGTLEERLLIKRSGLKGALGENPKNVFGQTYRKKPFTRMAVASIIRNGFLKALPYRHLAKEELSVDFQELWPFIEVLNGSMPLRLHCHRADDIATALRIADEFGVKLHLEHATEGYMMIDAIQKAGVAVTLGPFMMSASKYELRNSTPKSPALMDEAGIPFAIMTDHPFTPIQYLSVCAAEAVKYGLSSETALASITRTAAELAGISNRVGSLEVGKDADLAVWTGHPFATKTKLCATYINGSCAYHSNPQ
ncbi:amidohydrolase [Shouchella clausii]|uniref:Amidohydrolase n=1 Tax=Shouchella clausii TaxID=79880 RepID=A0A268S4D2_SHOCL|nr:amidohydrolase [Shouchella clausii]PAD44393.1 amidohydrolase [Bacillus sp. 7520-S]SPT79278.1 amidohydrolase [Niallia circulans]AST95094.1 amidohydrolase [Shouchella clausii]MBU8598641.1 amidohydrolase [Shouchella clausii]MCM3549586.1 amidohydrolase [Shouchella clausii]